MKLTIKEINNILNDIDERIPMSEAFSDNELRQLDLFSENEEEEIRSRVAVILASFTEEKGEEILVKLTKDKDFLVRVQACDSLSQSQSFAVYELLKKIANQDKNSMVRGFAISSLSQIALEIDKEMELTAFLLQRLKYEQAIFTKINIYKALYDMGEKKYLDCLLDNLNDKIYRNRCAVVHLLEEVIDNHNCKKIIEALKKRRKIEKTIAVNATIDTLLAKIDK